MSTPVGTGSGASTHPGGSTTARARRVLVVVAIVALGFNLRPTAVSVGPVLDEITRGLRMSAVTAGVLTTLPVLAFAFVGAQAPGLARRIGVHRVTLLALLAVVVGLALRARAEQSVLFLVLTFGSLGGMATANVLLPSLVKLHFPDRIGLMTSVYTTALAIGLTAGSVATVPIAEQLGSWRWGLGAWAVTAAVAAVPWVALVGRDRPRATAPASAAATGPEGAATSDAALDTPARAISLRDVARTRLGWGMAAFFGFQSLLAYSVFGWFAQIYRDAGFSASTAGLMLGVVTAISIPLSFVLPTWAAGMKNQTWLVGVLCCCYPLGFLGMLLAPVRGAWVWAVVVGVGGCVFPVVLTLIGLRARTSQGTAALSGFAQSVGYLIAAVGPLGMGLLYELTGGWTIPLLALILCAVPQMVAGLAVSRPAYLEDQLPPRPSGIGRTRSTRP